MHGDTPRENLEQRTEPMDENLDQEADSPFSMTQIKASVIDEEPARERSNLVRARLKPEMQAAQSGLTKSEPIMIDHNKLHHCRTKGIRNR